MGKRIIKDVNFEQRWAFLSESNRIERITDSLTDAQEFAFDVFLKSDVITIDKLKYLTITFQSDAELRDKEGLDVMVGSHKPPPGGPLIESYLKKLLEMISFDDLDPFYAHMEYEKLHPFTDCNGRTGRMIWAWQMIRLQGAGLSNIFLHEFYYQALRGRA